MAHTDHSETETATKRKVPVRAEDISPNEVLYTYTPGDRRGRRHVLASGEVLSDSQLRRLRRRTSN